MTTNTQDESKKPGAWRKIFNFLSKAPKRSFTLGGMIFGESDSSQFDFNMLKAWRMPRAMRIAERAVTLGGIFASAAYVATAVAAPVVAIPAMLGLALASKVAGVATAMGVRVALNKAEKSFK